MYKAFNRKTNEYVALKVLNEKPETFKKDEVTKREIEIMKQIKNENVVSLRNVVYSQNNVIFEVDLCEGGDLFYRISTKGKMDEKEASFVFSQLVNAIDYLHSKNIIHRDLKPENILLMSNKPFPSIKIADFGMAKLSTFGTTSCGTIHYAAPEVILQNNPGKYTGKCDVWSIGIILYVILSATHPFSMDDENLLYTQIKDAKFDFNSDVWSLVSDEPKKLIRKMIVVNPDERCSIKDLVDCHWIVINSKYYPVCS